MHRADSQSTRRRVTALLVALLVTGLPTPAQGQADAYPAAGGPISITPFAGAGVQIEFHGTVIHVDPWSRGDYSFAARADLILITDTPADHLDPPLIDSLRKATTAVVVPARPSEARDEGGATRLRAVPDATVMANGERRSFSLPGAEVVVEAVAMYDLVPGEPFHAKGEGNGYVITLGGARIYLAGVTECTPEMQAVRNVDVLFVPMNLPNGRMPPSAAAACTRLLSPRVVYPYHYREQPIDDFVDSLRGDPVEVRVRDWYPPS
jgi:L-ascorbate metabolism protein UlaG (beta-lactamase superfamily)